MITDEILPAMTTEEITAAESTADTAYIPVENLR